MTKYSKFMYYWSAMVCAIDDNEIEIQNLLLEKIEEMLPFKDAQEQKDWCDIVATYKFFEDFETATMRIARRLSKKESLKTTINEYVKNHKEMQGKKILAVDLQKCAKECNCTLYEVMEVLKR